MLGFHGVYQHPCSWTLKRCDFLSSDRESSDRFGEAVAQHIKEMLSGLLCPAVRACLHHRLVCASGRDRTAFWFQVTGRIIPPQSAPWLKSTHLYSGCVVASCLEPMNRALRIWLVGWLAAEVLLNVVKWSYAQREISAVVWLVQTSSELQQTKKCLTRSTA